MPYAYSDENVAALETTLSSDRLTKYLDMADGEKVSALKNYILNTRISEAFYTPLQGIEVCVRNAIHRELSEIHGEHWYEPNVAILQHKQNNMVETAKRSLADKKKPSEPGRIVAELNFGFWVGMLGPKYETTLWRQCLRHSFSNRPKKWERKQVHNAMNSVRRLRNRVAHHEPILHRNLRGDHELIIQIISCVCRDTAQWVRAHSRFESVVEKIT